MFLFDKYRGGIQNYITGNNPNIEWETYLNTNPIFGAESTAAMDDEGNLYFGSHSGNFYSLTNNGRIRWVFSTSKKIYSSPLLKNNMIFFTSGDGFIYCLSLQGRLLWAEDMGKTLKSKRINRHITDLIHIPFTFDIKKRKNITYKSWASPNSFEDYIVVTGFGKGLQCYSLNGKLEWEFDLGFPRYQLSGVAIDSDNNIYTAARNGFFYKINSSGSLVWKILIRHFWEPWGNPVVDKVNGIVYSFYSSGETKGLLSAHDLNGKLRWQLRRNTAIRGSCAIGKNNNIYACDLDGYIFEINLLGKVIKEKRITAANRGLWTTPTLDAEHNILLTTKDGPNSGRIIKLDKEFNEIWAVNVGKALSVPIVDSNGSIYIGSWSGKYYCINTF